MALGRSVLYLVFVLSGAAGLVYEMVWSRYLGLFLGHSAYAQVLVIAIFLGGMALGALLLGSRSERWRDPLIGYVAIELVAGAIGIVFHEVFQAATDLAYETIFPRLASPALLTSIKWALAALLVLPQSILLGATFPLIAAGILRRAGDQPGVTLAILYFSNSLGAAAGVLVAGFALIAAVGLPGTLLVAGLTNLLVALVAAGVAFRFPVRPPAPSVASAPPASDAAVAARAVSHSGGPSANPIVVRFLLILSFGSAAASFFYEIGWLRMLALVLGSATHSFELMLSAFILGLALGSLSVRRHVDRWRNPLRVLGIVQLAMGACALASLPLYVAAFDGTAWLLGALARSDAGFELFTVTRYVLCLAIMLPTCFCAGMTVPVVTRILVAGGLGERAIGKVYGVNTFGSITGVALAGLIFIPWLGLKGLVTAGAILDMSLGAAALAFDARRDPAAPWWRRYGAVALVLLLAVGSALSPALDPLVLTSGVYRTGSVPEKGSREVVFYEDGRTASVALSRFPNGVMNIAANGKTEASVPGSWMRPCTQATVRHGLALDTGTQSLMALVPLGYVPSALHALTVGHGSGMTSHVLLGSPHLESLVTVEIEPEVIDASRLLLPANRNALEDPRSRIVIGDARTYLASSGRRYDIILSQPSNPWVSGNASLFTREFYELTKRAMRPDGIFAQWLQLYEISDDLVMGVLGAVHASFPSYRVHLVDEFDVLIVASLRPSLPRPDWSLLAGPGVRQALCHALVPTAQNLAATAYLDRRVLAPVLDEWPNPNSDYFPTLDLGTERARFLSQSPVAIRELRSTRFDFVGALAGQRTLPDGVFPIALPRLARIADLALTASLRDAAPPGGAPVGIQKQWSAVTHRLRQWKASLAGGLPPPDWSSWLSEFKLVEGALHAGTAGYVDDDLYDEAFRYLQRQGASDVVRSVVELWHGLASWRFDESARAAGALLDAHAVENGLVRPSDLLEGGVVSFLKIGDAKGARRLLDRLMRTGIPTSLRIELIEAHVRQAERLRLTRP